jgi:hypothetical protein
MSLDALFSSGAQRIDNRFARGTSLEGAGAVDPTVIDDVEAEHLDEVLLAVGLAMSTLNAGTTAPLESASRARAGADSSALLLPLVDTQLSLAFVDLDA